MENNSLLRIKNLSIAFFEDGNQHMVVEDMSYHLDKNEILGVVGESGSGKTISALSLLGLLPKKSAKITQGEIHFKSQELHKLSDTAFQKVRGKQIGMIFQEPMSALNPAMTCGQQLTETLWRHTSLNRKERKKAALSWLKKVKIPQAERVYRAYPHEISGGQQQRVMIAMAVCLHPNLLIADEPTTALDVTVQKDIIALLKSLQRETKMSVLFISHDLSLVREIANRVLIMHRGKVVEHEETKQIFKAPKHFYTKALINARPSPHKRLKKLPTLSDFYSKKVCDKQISREYRKKKHDEIYAKPPLLEVVDLEKNFLSKVGWFKKDREVKALNRVSFKLYEGETLGLVGESGCGKTTLGKTLLLLRKPTSGKILYRGEDLHSLNNKQVKKLRKEIQMIFQDPYASLNPKRSVGSAITEPLKVHRLYSSREERHKKAKHLLEQVGLKTDYFHRYPHELSGGQRQRVCIARAIAVEPKLIVCDESVSALDISIQAQVLNLLNELKERLGLTYIFISHDLTVVKHMSDQLLVMRQGEIVEQGEADQLYKHPQKSYTQKLIDAMPTN